jgi:hypothetical protein
MLIAPRAIKEDNYGTRPSNHSSANFSQRRCHPVSRAHAWTRTSEYLRFDQGHVVQIKGEERGPRQHDLHLKVAEWRIGPLLP